MRFFRKKYSGLSDEALMECVGRGEIPAFDVLYERYAQRLLYYFWKMLSRDNEKAQDFVQEIFLKIVERPELFNPEKKFSTWFFSVAHNMCKNEYRKLEARNIYDTDADVEEFSSQENFFENINREEFRKAFAAELELLADAHREIFLLRYDEDFSIREIAEITGIAEGTVKSRIFYTTKKLAEKLKNFAPTFLL